MAQCLFVVSLISFLETARPHRNEFVGAISQESRLDVIYVYLTLASLLFVQAEGDVGRMLLLNSSSLSRHRIFNQTSEQDLCSKWLQSTAFGQCCKIKTALLEQDFVRQSLCHDSPTCFHGFYIAPILTVHTYISVK